MNRLAVTLGMLFVMVWAAVAGVAVVSTVPRRDDNHCMPALGPNAEVDKCLHLAAAPSTYQGDRLRRAAE